MNLFGALMHNVRKQHFNLSDFPNGFFDSLIQKAKSLLTVNRIMLFGSFARGDALEKSDIDIAIDFKDGDWIKFKDWVEEKFPTLRQVDIIDLNNVNTEFAKRIEQECIELYNRDKINLTKKSDK